MQIEKWLLEKGAKTYIKFIAENPTVWRFPETSVVGNRVNSVDVRSIVEGVWGDPEP